MSAILVIVANGGKPKFVMISILPIGLFFVLDAYYWALEKGFRESYETFIEKLHAGTLVASDIYAVSPNRRPRSIILEGFLSFSVWPFYVTMFAVALIVGLFVI